MDVRVGLDRPIEDLEITENQFRPDYGTIASFNSWPVVIVILFMLSVDQLE